MAAEVLKTLVGSFGLVMVAPFTAVVGGLVLTAGRRPREKQAGLPVGHTDNIPVMIVDSPLHIV